MPVGEGNLGSGFAKRGFAARRRVGHSRLAVVSVIRGRSRPADPGLPILQGHGSSQDNVPGGL